ncbi:MAG: hypothetical protein F6J86_24130 [Symploca sp. SIO1B1]|nr:hypothetical protein [Symploca sp. SIO1B1]
MKVYWGVSRLRWVFLFFAAIFVAIATAVAGGVGLFTTLIISSIANFIIFRRLCPKCGKINGGKHIAKYKYGDGAILHTYECKYCEHRWQLTDEPSSSHEGGGGGDGGGDGGG